MDVRCDEPMSDALIPLRPQAVAKFGQALGIEPSRHDTLWCLGNAYTSQARARLLRNVPLFCPRRSTAAAAEQGFPVL